MASIKSEKSSVKKARKGKKALLNKRLGGGGRVKQANRKKLSDWLVFPCKMVRNALSYSSHYAKMKKIKGGKPGISLPFWTEY